MEKTADFDLTTEELWEVVGDPEGLAEWLGEEVDVEVTPGGRGRVVDDGEVRELEVDEVEPGRRLAFRWWPEDDETETSEVELVVVPLHRGSRLVITERPVRVMQWQARLAA